ncbi:MAG TPA: multicopper oxidase domain-containing protein, partial [Candidatus Eisenbacteria bacterium]|nr:multicopper oxidase domain-containing protein [Candidatus Eisenbacteria bacterium]
PSGNYDVPLVLQDRMFTTDGQLWYPNEGDNEEHPVWTPEFFGDAIVINGKVWPYFNVEPRKYRFRMVNGSNSRVYSMSLNERMTGGRGPAFVQIGTDGGLLAEPVVLNDPALPASPRLILATGERADVVIDFSAYPVGTEFILRNVAKEPYPNGAAVDPQGAGQMMLFRVVESTGPDDSVVPANLATFERLTNPILTRTLTLNELMGMEGPLGAFLNGQGWDDPTPETPALGTTEMWEVVNMTGDTHPIHLHLVQFQLLNRQRVNLKKYEKDWSALNPVFPAAEIHSIPVDGYLKGKPMPADPNERGWKDTFRMNPGEVTRILVRFAPQDAPSYSFDATAEPGYVWHCHIIEHEDNEMMRRMEVQPASMAAVVADALAARSAASAASLDAAPVSFRNASSNPASSGGAFNFSLKSAGPVELDLFSVDGRLVKRLASGWFERGEHTVSWTRSDQSGRDLASGVYLVRFRGDGAESSKKLVVIP